MSLPAYYHEGVPAWVQRTLKAHDRDLEVVYFRWWVGQDGTSGRFLVLVRTKTYRGRATLPVEGDGQLNLRDWGLVLVVEDAAGGRKVPDRATVDQVLAADRVDVTPDRWLKSLRRGHQAAQDRRQAARRAEHAAVLTPEIAAGMAGRVTGRPILKEFSHA